ncbi:hypothetical protein GUJ93_ZPchr0010g7845 [Zizania palustris]|uniref:Wall-associated receptor kinase galacturonan-binding domain-containing protein n=1 Tax=Zizania palustris TaxID=103762 RepID=A0A8J5WBQ6_ZIZPA|nr:hypothetical protein GUJ93_ZPchr0010g7845 [Zizania palustris]KAG8086316.1 hypothetical protein GUJ93_ZPchr0010g7845 [Zizania palustris]KAG8086317.1 hypothetical protein GUJ93_ZPchr0010g7845 [Zizania palustris]
MEIVSHRLYVYLGSFPLLQPLLSPSELSSSSREAPLQTMYYLHLLQPLTLIILLLSSVPSSAPQSDAYFRYMNCAPVPYQCGSVRFDVDYPFSVTGAGLTRPDYCSYPGYRLFCTDDKLVIYTDNSIAFQVTGVDYGNMLLAVIDQNLAPAAAGRCPQRYRNTTIDESKFIYTDRDQFLTVYVNCTANSSSLPLLYDLLSCFSGGSSSYYRLDASVAPPDVLASCTHAARLSLCRTA